MKITHLIILLLCMLLLAVVLETTIINFPFIVICGLGIAVYFKKLSAYVLVFILGIVLDSLRVSHFGVTPIFIFGALLAIFLYEKYFGSNDLMVATVIGMSFIFAYAYFLSYSLMLVVLFYALIATIWMLSNFFKKKNKAYL